MTDAAEGRIRHQFITLVLTQVLSTGFFTLQWIAVYIYHVITQDNDKTAEHKWAIHYFVFSLANNLYYVNSIKSFYLSTLTSRLFREAFIALYQN